MVQEFRRRRPIMTANLTIKTEAAWTNEPATWHFDPQGRLVVQTRGRTDYWRKTRNGFIGDNGHLYSVQVRGDFIMRARISAEFRELYDQAGLMVMFDKTVWLKAGIEYLEGARYISTVVTHDYSDGALSRPLAGEALWLVVERDREGLIVSASLDGESYFVVRECTLTDALTLEVGPYACSPAGEGLTATFEGFEIQQPRQPRRS